MIERKQQSRRRKSTKTAEEAVYYANGLLYYTTVTITPPNTTVDLSPLVNRYIHTAECPGNDQVAQGRIKGKLGGESVAKHHVQRHTSAYSGGETDRLGSTPVLKSPRRIRSD